MDFIWELLQPIIGSDPSLKDFAILLAAIITPILSFLEAKNSRKVKSQGAELATKDTQIATLNAKLDDIMKVVGLLAQQMMIAFTSSKGLDPAVKAALSDLYTEVKTMIGTKAKELFTEAISAAAAKLTTIVTEEQKQAVMQSFEKQEAAVEENRANVDALLEN